MLTNYIKIAWRNLIKNKISTTINILGLSIGISACMVILLFVNYELTFDKHHTKSDQTYRVVQHTKMPDQTLYWNTTAYPLAQALREDIPEIDIVTQIAGPMRRHFEYKNETGKSIKFEVPYVVFADAYYHHVFNMQWLAGNPNEALAVENGVVLTTSLVEKYFGKISNSYDAILGKTLLLNSKDPLTVTGIIENAPGNTTQKYSMLVAYSFFKKHNPYPSENWSGNYQGTTFITTKDKGIATGLATKINAWKKKYLKPEDDKRISYALQPVSEIHTETLYGSSPGGYTIPKKTLYIAGVIALFILGIAIINFINLVTAQSTARSKEVGVRKVLGSRPVDLIYQFIFENSLLIIITITLSIGITTLLLQLLNNKLTIIDLQLAIQWQHISILLGVGIVTILCAAIYPAVILASFKPIQALKNQFSHKNRTGLSLRKSLLLFQFIVVQLFVIAAIVVSQQVKLFSNGDLGFSKEAVITTETPEYKKLDVYKEALLEDASITNVAFGSGPPMAVNGLQLGTNYRLSGTSIDEAMGSEMKIIGPNYIDFYGLELLAGRNISENKEAFDEFIVNEKIIQAYGWTPQEAIGKRITINEGEAPIVGVVKNFHNNSLQYEISPCILMNWAYFKNKAFIKTSTINPTTIGTIEDTWGSVFSKGVYKYHFLDEAIAKEYTIERLILNGFTIFSLLAICIGCLGLMGLMTFITARNTKVIGIRKVLGATLFQNVSFFSKEFIGVVLIAFIIATPIVYYFMDSWLEGFTYSITMTPWMFIIGGLLTLILAIITCSFQSIKASLANPIKSLQTE